MWVALVPLQTSHWMQHFNIQIPARFASSLSAELAMFQDELAASVPDPGDLSVIRLRRL